MESKKLRRRRILAWTAGVGAGLVLAAAMIVQWVVAPAIIRDQIEANLADRWDGRAEIRSIRFSWAGAIRLVDLDLNDSAGRNWVHADSIELGVANMISAHPALSRVIARGLVVRKHYGATIPSPIKPAPPSTAETSADNSSAADYLDLRRVEVDGAFELVDEAGAVRRWDGLELRVSPTGKDLGIAIRHAAATPFAVDGVIDPRTLLGQLRLKIDHPFEAPEMSAILAAAGRVGLNASGSLTADLEITGNLTNLATAKIAGRLDLADWRVWDTVGPLAEKLTLETTFEADRRVGFTLRSEKVLTGRIDGRGFVQVQAGQAPSYGGRLAVGGLDMARLYEATGGRSFPDKGLLTGESTFSGLGDEFDSFHSDITAMLENADMMNIPLLPELLRQIGVADLGALDSSDLVATVSITGPTVTVKRANLANAVSALEAQPGGVINLRTRQIDLHVVGVPVKHLSGLLELPVVSLFADLGKKLTRIHVEGPWTDSPASLVKVEPLSNVSEGTLEFFVSAARDGGKLGEGVIKGVAGVFQSKDKDQ